MCDEWMPVVTLPMTAEQYHQLPRNPAFRYEYLGVEARLSPQPRFYHALLDLHRCPPPGPLPHQVTVRGMQESDFADLARVFAAAFERQQPFASLDSEKRLVAARASLDKVRAGNDGPWLRQGSFVAVENNQCPVGAILVTLLPDEDPAEWDSFYWREPPPPDCIARRLGRPHITWIFVSPWHAGRGAGSALLGAAAAALREMGYRTLASTFLLGNDSSMLWHWR